MITQMRDCLFIVNLFKNFKTTIWMFKTFILIRDSLIDHKKTSQGRSNDVTSCPIKVKYYLW